MIIASEIKDYKSNSANSDGGAITATQIKVAQLSALVAAGATALPVYDSAGILNGETLVIDDNTNKEAVTVNSTVTPTSIPCAALTNGYAAETPVGSMNALFPNITGAESESGVTKYRKFYRKNTNGSSILANPRSYIPNQVENAALSVGFGLDHADDTDGAQGNMVTLAADDTVEVVSDGADTRTVTVSGLRASDGAFISEIITLDGTTPVASVNTFKANGVVRAYVSALSASRSVIVRRNTGDTLIGTIGINKKISFLWFGKKITAGSVANAEGGDVPGGAPVDATNSILFADIAAGENIPYWLRYMAAAGSAAAGYSTGVVSTKGETT